MISISDSEEPTWPRSPPASVRTTRRRRYFERSSSCGLTACSGDVISAGAPIGIPLPCGGKRRQQISCAIELARLRRVPAFGGAGEQAILPAFGNELVEQNECPAQGEQRQQRAKPLFEIGIRAIEPNRPLTEALAMRSGKLMAGMQQDIGGQLHRIIPAKIFEINEGQGSVRAANAVVEPEIRRNEAPLFLREFRGKIKPPGVQACPRLGEPLPMRGIEGFLQG